MSQEPGEFYRGQPMVKPVKSLTTEVDRRPISTRTDVEEIE
jgi:hypothetical protein